MSETIVKVEGVYKKFSKGLRRGLAYGFVDITRAALGMSPKSDRLREGEFWALKNINFTLDRGEVLGVIGVNGAGKSTLLRILNGIYPPDAGRVEVRGNLGGLIALGAGFHPHLSGRENIYLNGTILGMSKPEITSKLDSIMEFADIGSFIDSPVSNYSSGMYARLGFAIAIHCEPDILLVDEVLSVGDFSFQNKCLRRISELKKEARGIIFIGHNMDMIETVCDKALLLHNQEVYAYGDPLEVIAAYRAVARELELRADEREHKQKHDEDGFGMRTQGVTFLGAGILDKAGKQTRRIDYGSDVDVFYDLKAEVDIDKPQLGVGFSHPRVYPYNIAYVSNISDRTIEIPPMRAGESYRVRVRFQKPNLIPGVYRLNIMIRDGNALELLHQVDKDKSNEFEIAPIEVGSFVLDGSRASYNSLIALETEWSCEKLM